MKREGKKKMQVTMMEEGNERCELEEVEESNSQRRSGNKFKVELGSSFKRYSFMKIFECQISVVLCFLQTLFKRNISLFKRHDTGKQSAPQGAG